ncbi:hypothetical protein BD779DRAFT_1547223 [Infundibulicybe gibba]|nr:hypothetical protein BD779DRAFT_1547223 [Infundibulicybe gibba]
MSLCSMMFLPLTRVMGTWTLRDLRRCGQLEYSLYSETGLSTFETQGHETPKNSYIIPDQVTRFQSSTFPKIIGKTFFDLCSSKPRSDFRAVHGSWRPEFPSNDAAALATSSL